MLRVNQLEDVGESIKVLRAQEIISIQTELVVYQVFIFLGEFIKGAASSFLASRVTRLTDTVNSVGFQLTLLVIPVEEGDNLIPVLRLWSRMLVDLKVNYVVLELLRRLLINPGKVLILHDHCVSFGFYFC